MNNGINTDSISRKLLMFGGEAQLTKDETKIICEALENLKKANQGQPSTIYELVDRDACPVMYLDISALYPKAFVMQQINQCIADDVDTSVIRHRLKESCNATEINLEHVILPHIE